MQRLPETSFEQNLASFTEANNTALPSDFKVKRELDIARYALEESLALHSVVTQSVRAAINSLGESQDDLYKLITLANSLEERHRKLQMSAKVVASIAKSGAEIENLLASKLDAAQVYSILVQLPALLLAVLQSQMMEYLRNQKLSLMNGDVLDSTAVEQHVAELANTVANTLNDEIEKNVNVLTYGGDAANAERGNSSSNSGGQVAIVEEQVVAMLQTVPAGTVVDASSEEAEVIDNA